MNYKIAAALFLFLGALLWLYILASCSDVDPLPPDPYDATRIEGGTWYTQPPAQPLWIYEFHYPHLRQWIVDFGSTVTEQEYIYAPKADTLYISGAGGQRAWTVHFPDDSTCIYRRLMPGVITPPAVTLRR